MKRILKLKLLAMNRIESQVFFKKYLKHCLARELYLQYYEAYSSDHPDDHGCSLQIEQDQICLVLKSRIIRKF